MYTYFLFLTGILWGILFAPSAWAEAPQVDFSTLSSSAVVEQSDRSGTPHPVVARLITDKSAVQEGGVLRLGVHLTMEDKWKFLMGVVDRLGSTVGRQLQVTFCEKFVLADYWKRAIGHNIVYLKVVVASIGGP